ncbi:MAG: hypothetical protein E7440_02570 [Ruminococcaceae bacterium]|nr:hypothetical protein [Oscillospiraceae bacterium]
MEQQRMASWWIHWEDLNWPNPDNLDKIKARAEGLAKANVTAAMIFGTHFRWDWLPVFPLLHDYLATVAEELHKYGVKLYDHHSVNLVHRYSTREQMRHVMQDSGPHLPFSPTWEAAATWQYKGKYLNDWRMVDVRTGKPAYLPQYTAEGFCHRNPEYQQAYYDYIKTLVSDTGIDGLSADDPMHYIRFNTCGCRYCRAELKRRSGIDLPPVEDSSFWFNWDNPAWHHWVDLRFDATGEFLEGLRKALPEQFMLTGCGSDSASSMVVGMASDARQFLRGCNYVNMEMNGNTPPYKHDPITINRPIAFRLTSASHHQAAARERGVRAFNTGFAHTTVAANHCWALSKLLGADIWISTLKTRLGLPWSILKTLPEEHGIVGEAFGFEKDHPELFRGNAVGQLGVYFSYETRNHTMCGALVDGYAKDFSQSISQLFRNGITPHTIFTIPDATADYPVILLSSVARMTPEEQERLRRYLAAGGKVIVTGPTPLAGCVNSWNLPNRVETHAEQNFLTVPDGIRPVDSLWTTQTKLPECSDPDAWSEPEPGLFYHPHRISSGVNLDGVLERCRRYMKPMPVKVLEAKGYLSSIFEEGEKTTIHFMAEDYDVGIDHELDEMRTHRSRLNLINHVEPIGVSGVLRMEAELCPNVYTPFHSEPARVSLEDGICTVTLPDKCSYAIVQFESSKELVISQP